MMKKLMFGAVLTVMAVAQFSAPAFADTKIAYVNSARLANDVPQRGEEDEKLKQQFEKRGEQLREKFEAFQAKGEKFQKDKVLLSKEKQQSRLKELQEEELALLKEKREFDTEFAKQRNAGINRLEDLISEVIADIAKKRDIDIVLQQVVYADESIDITDEVIAELKKRQ